VHLGARASGLVTRLEFASPTPWQIEVNRLAIIKEFLQFLRERKKWWLAPIVIFLLLLGGLLVFAKGSALAPFIYSLF
jgi:hypothetical protein